MNAALSASPVLLPLALCWPFLSMGALAACSPASARPAAIGLSAIGLLLAILAAGAGAAWPATPFAAPPGLLRLLPPLPLLALFLSTLLPPAATPRRDAHNQAALTQGLAGGSALAATCADPLSGAVAVGGVAMLAALAIATTRGAARLGWDMFRLSLSGILLAVPGAVLLAAAPGSAGRLDGLGGVLLATGLGVVAGLGPATPVMLAAEDAPAAMALAPVMTAIPVLRHLAVAPDGRGTMLLGLATIWLAALPMRRATARRRGRLALGGLIGLAAIAAGATANAAATATGKIADGAGAAGLAALLLSAALLAPLADRPAATAGHTAPAGFPARALRGALAFHPPFLPFGGLLLTLAALTDAAPLLLAPLVLGLLAGRAPRASAATPADIPPGPSLGPSLGAAGPLAVVLLLAAMTALIAWFLPRTLQ
ncbi:hypothetical protein [Nguyenibacter sp. L1]|uniref:hypothetical protein n=1 Tax=Nguyenibacter sp. L1 TaxID=3049350 RepID=UPI002B47AB7C|nr:hypothetical protein [Nguyenibacter sp. L1]WRH87586.1 hypothetical protein QN315_16705 [Nguyenibacter sp. L1]